MTHQFMLLGTQLTNLLRFGTTTLQLDSDKEHIPVASLHSFNSIHNSAVIKSYQKLLVIISSGIMIY